MIKACFHVDLYPQTIVDIKGHGFELVETSASDTAYWEAIRDRWGKDDLLILEQDMQYSSDFLASFESCPEPWCLYGYEILVDGVTASCETGIGLCRIRKEMQERISFEAEIPVHWGWVGSWLNYLADVHGVKRHVHGSVNHYHKYKPVIPNVPDWEIKVKRTPQSEDQVYTDNVFHNGPPPWNDFSAVKDKHE